MDATNIERNLYLTMQLMELDVPMVLALNMMDEVSAAMAVLYDVNQMERGAWNSGCTYFGSEK